MMKKVNAALKYKPTDAEMAASEQGNFTCEQANLFLSEETRSPDEALALISQCIHFTNVDTALHLIKEVDWKTTLLAQVEAELTTHGVGKVRCLSSIFADMRVSYHDHLLIRISTSVSTQSSQPSQVTQRLIDEYYVSLISTYFHLLQPLATYIQPLAKFLQHAYSEGEFSKQCYM
jgi:hypothetical protein